MDMQEHNVNAGLNKTPIYIRSIKDCPPSYLHDPHRKDFFEVLWLKDEFPIHDLKDGEDGSQGHWIYLLPPYRVHKLNKSGKKGVLLSFKRDLLDEGEKEFSLNVFKLFNLHGEYSYLKLSADYSDELCKVYDLMMEEYQKENTSLNIIQSFLKAFLLNIIRMKEEVITLQDVNQKRVYEFMLLLEEHYLKHRDTGFYAEQLGISAKRLNQILKEKLQNTVLQLIHDRLILEIKRNIIHSEHSLKEIAYLLKFKEYPYFSRFFKQHTSQTPEEFKKQAKLHLTTKANTLF